ncbi:PD-(D/E)XK nuclease family protein [Nonlabens xiamenensis]|uniref:PD-(D/E)XK nuclease family protein n=1 Tax=Nonlabens xiamenensis TaxID=2341043 RepID=UPI000F60F40A|nr:PD-(D/E)XK nuclease family protein [Nonlabens xiamenensis]
MKLKSFLESVLDDLNNKGVDPIQCRYVVPSRRVGVFLSRYLAVGIDCPVFMPEILSVEEYIEQCAGAEIWTDLDLMPVFYEAYCEVEHDNENRDKFDAFLTWAPTILKDFNEIDRYLVDPDVFFNFLGNVKELEQWHWSLDNNPTQMVSQYLDFWKRLRFYYDKLAIKCAESKIAYQGLAYRWAAHAILNSQAQLAHKNPSSPKADKVKAHQGKLVFLGLNALNAAESQIIQHLLEQEKAVIYWDVDEYLLERPYHEASHFIRGFQKEWKYYESHPLEIIGNGFKQEKNIEIHGATGHLGMVQVAAQLLSSISEEQLKSTAVILADETLLLPLLNAIPPNIIHFNVTMGLAADQLPIASFVNDLIQLHVARTEKGFYYRDLVRVLESTSAQHLMGNQAAQCIKTIKTQNLIYINHQQPTLSDAAMLGHILQPIDQVLELIFLLENLLGNLKSTLSVAPGKALEIEQLLAVTEVVQQMKELIIQQTEIKDLRTLGFLFRQLLSMKSLDFIGEPVQGLQIMGLLETRALDYEHIIMLSVNEGVLPTGKTTSSYIPHDMKYKFGLPTYSEKDSVYAYHFYRLLHRTTKASFIYNAEPGRLGGGEKSRFLTQLQTDDHTLHQISSSIYSYKNQMLHETWIEIQKDEAYFNRLNTIAENGFSPSAISSYVRNPIDFYASKILKIPELEEVEENIAANTMGSIIHEALERLYRPIKGQVLTEEHFVLMKKEMPVILRQSYDKCYASLEHAVGKNKIIFEVSLHYVRKMLDMDLELVKKGHELIIKDVELHLESSLEVPEHGKVKLHGHVDRIDLLDGQLRIIDYKSGAVEKAQVGLENEELDILMEDYAKSKAFQVLMYTYLYSKNEDFDNASSGIISFKRFAQGYLPFAIKSGRGYKERLIDQGILESFEALLIKIIQELFDPSISLKEKEV